LSYLNGFSIALFERCSNVPSCCCSLEAKDADCGKYGKICSYDIETESQPFEISDKGERGKSEHSF
jgi:hypothetical protein